jgi:hypothetical protein
VEGDDDFFVVQVDASDIPETRVISSEELAKMLQRSLPIHAAHGAALIAFQGGSQNGCHFDDYLWRLVDRLLYDPRGGKQVAKAH